MQRERVIIVVVILLRRARCEWDVVVWLDTTESRRRNDSGFHVRPSSANLDEEVHHL